MGNRKISIKGARVNNLKNVDLELPLGLSLIHISEPTRPST